MVLKQSRSPRRRTHAPGQKLHPPYPGSHPLRTHPPASSIRRNPHLQNLPYLRQLPPPENPEAWPDLSGRLRRLHPPGSYDPRLLLLRMPGRRIHPLLHHAPRRQHPTPQYSGISLIAIVKTRYQRSGKYFVWGAFAGVLDILSFQKSAL